MFDNLEEIFQDILNIKLDIKNIDINKGEAILFIKVIINNNSHDINFVLKKKNLDKIKDIDFIISNYNLLKQEYNRLKQKYEPDYPYSDKKVDSKILENCDKKEEFISQILTWCGHKKMELIYRGSRDGMNAKSFHDKCDNKGKTICLYQNAQGNIFGGYTSIPWTYNSTGEYFSDPYSFIFSLTNIYYSKPTKFPISKNSNVIYHYMNCGPVFGYGCDIWMANNFSDENNNYNNSNFPSSFNDVLGYGKSVFTGDRNNNNKIIKYKEIEVFSVN